MGKIESELKELNGLKSKIKELESELGIETSQNKGHIQKLRNLFAKFQELRTKTSAKNEKNNEFLKQILANRQSKYLQKKQYLDLICTFNKDVLLEVIKTVLESIENTEYKITSNGSNHVLASRGISKKEFTLSNQPKINLYESGLLDKNNDIFKTYPYLYELFTQMINYRLKHSFKDYTISDEEVCAYITRVFPLILKSVSENSELKIASNLIPIACKIAEALTEKDERGISWMKTSRSEAENFFETLMQGKYNSLLDKTYWFGEELNAEIMIHWNTYRKKFEVQGIKCSEISRENYLAFAELDSILSRINYINKNGSDYIPETGLYQTAATEEEMKKLEELTQTILRRNYTWREAREVVRNASGLRIYYDANFPHNIEQIIKAFNPSVITFYDKVTTTTDLKNNLALENIRTRASLLLDNLDINNLIQFFTMPNRDSIDEYIKRMILSIFDIPEIIFKNCHDSFKDTLNYIKENLAISSTLTPEVCAILFANPEVNRSLLSLTKGILKSLCFNSQVNDILGECKNIQQELECNRGTVGYNDYNSLRLPDGSTIISIYVEDIKPQYATFKEAYNFYYQSSNDLEFVEGCVELLGDIILTQIFRDGNKRTAKCLFNKMLISRGIIPPITDLNENEQELWNSMANGRWDRYPETKARLLKDTINMQEMLQDNTLLLPTTLSIEATERSEFQRRRY